MEAAVRKEYVLGRLHCPDCAAGIERDVAGIDGVCRARVDFESGVLSMEIDGADRVDEVMRRTGSVVGRHPEAFRPREARRKTQKRGELWLQGLDCAECAAKIEREVSRIEGVSSAALNFATGRLSVDADGEALPEILRQTRETIRRLEPDVTVSGKAPEAEAEPAGDIRERLERLPVIGGMFFFAVALAMPGPQAVKIALYLVAYLLAGGQVLLRSARNIRRGEIFDENFLMSVATLGAFAIGQFPEGVAVMLFYQIGEYVQDLAVNRSRRSISALMSIRPDFAVRLDGDKETRVTPQEIAVGQRIAVRPGERVPLDGVVEQGSAALDTSALTGESRPRDVAPGDEILSGSVSLDGRLVVRVTREFGQSAVSRILDLVQEAGSRKTVTENFITRFAHWYTPVVVGLAVALAVIPPLVLPGMEFSKWIYRALVFLVVSCPCALVVSVPLSFFAGLGGASRSGVLVKGGNFLEALARVDTVVFDKTGTLTQGVFEVTQVRPAEGETKERLLETAALAESYSNHPIAQSIRRAWGGVAEASRIGGIREIPGHGVEATVDGESVLAGNRRLMEQAGVVCPDDPAAGTVVHLCRNGAYLGSLVISDRLRPDSRRAVEQLHAAGVSRMVMLTGDSRAAADRVAGELGLDGAYAELLPEQKVEKLEQLARELPAGRGIAFVGDGINDAPVLARADVGVAMGGLGSDAAIEAADVVLMTDSLSRLPAGIGIARRTHRIVWENIVFALGVKVVLLVLGALGLASMWAAVFGDAGVTLLAVLNAIRALHVPAAFRPDTAA